MEQQDLSEYVASKRSLFLLRFSLDVKKDEMRKLEEQASEEERRLEVGLTETGDEHTHLDLANPVPALTLKIMSLR